MSRFRKKQRRKANWNRRRGFLICRLCKKTKEALKMKKTIGTRTIPWLLLASLAATGAHAAGNKVVIGDIDDMSGLYADVIGPGGIEAAKMAIEDFGGSVLANKSELMNTHHQNKTDLAAKKFRE